MNRPSNARLLAAGVAVALVATPIATMAHPDHTSEPPGKLPTESGHAIIHGQVVAKHDNKPLDDVRVIAVRPTKRLDKWPDGEIRAADLSYASPDNEIEHGYFAMWVPHGNYAVTFYKKDFEQKRIEVRKYQDDKSGLGYKVKLEALPDTDLIVGGGKRTATKLTFSEGDEVAVEVEVSSKAKGRPTGLFTLVRKNGKKLVGVDSIKLKGKKKEEVLFDLGELDKGKDTYLVTYEGDKDFHSATSKPFKIEVKKAKKSKKRLP